MPMDLDEVAAAIADGRPINWGDVGAGPNLTLGLARRARIVERIAQLHASFPPPATFAGSLQTSLLHIEVEPQADSGALMTWGPLTILERIGSGTFGEVYRARDPRLNRQVALKLLRRRDRRGATVIEEGQLMARVRHPNVVTVYGAERIDGRVGLWMEFVDGPTLDQELKTKGPFSADVIARVGIDLCSALDAVHRAGLVHRDIKAQNVMRDPDGRVLLTDFGAGRELVEIGATAAGELAGTPLYLAPEVLDGQVASPASDIYSLGVLLFYLATGSFPVHGRSLPDVREAHADGRRVSIKDFGARLPPFLSACIARAIDADPARRFRTATEMEVALRGGTTAQRSSIGWRTSALLTAAGAAALAIASALFGPFRFVAQSAAVRPGTAPPAAATAGTRAMRQISSDSELAGPGSPSPDGSMLSYVDSNTCNLAIAETATDRRWMVTANPASGDPDGGCAATSRFSAAGSELFYVWSFDSGDRRVSEIRRIGIHGGMPRTIWRAPEDFDLVLMHWTGHDRFLLAGAEGDDDHDLVVIDAADGTVRARRAMGPRLPNLASLSPDGSLIVYDRPGSADLSDRAVVVAQIDSAAEDIIAQSPAVDDSPLWTNDGRYVLFKSDRSGQQALWAQRVADGRAAGPPVRLEPNLGWAFPMGLTATSSYFVRREMGTRDVFLANLDPGSGTVAGDPVRVSAAAGANGTSDWSPDGRSLAFFRDNGWGRTLMIKSLDDGREREIVNHRLYGVARPRWEPGGRTLLLKGVFRYVGGLHRLDLQTGQIITLMRFPAHARFQEYEVFPGDREVLYASRQRHEFVRRDLASGRETVVHRVDPALSMLCMALSRDGRRFAYGAYRPKVGWSMRVVDVRDPANAREIMQRDANVRVCPSVWTPDGLEVIYTQTQEVQPPAREATRLWAVNADTEQVRLIGLSVDGLNEVRLSPDGHRITYDGGWPFQEVWMLENALGGLQER